MMYVANPRQGLKSPAFNCTTNTKFESLTIFSLTLLLILAVFAVLVFGYILPCRTPLSWDESEYARSALEVRKTLNTSSAWQQFLLDARYCSWHSSLIASLFALPLLHFLGSSHQVFFLASVAMGAVCTILIFVVTYLAMGQGLIGCLAGATSALMFALSPGTLLLASMFMSEMPSALMLVLNLFAYLIARRLRNPLAFVVSSIILFLSVYARAERGILFLPIFLCVYLVDEVQQFGWRRAVDAAITGVGLIGLVVLCLQQYVFSFPVHTLKALGVNLLALTGLCFSVYYTLKGRPGSSQMLLYALPASLLLLLWLYQGQNVTVLNIYKSHTTSFLKGAPLLQNLLLLLTNYSSNWGSASLKGVLLLFGIIAAAKRWPGLLAAVLLFGLQLSKAMFVEMRFVFFLHTALVVLAGLGAPLLVTTINAVTSRVFSLKTSCMSSAIFIVLCALISLPGLYGRMWTLYEGSCVTPFHVFDRRKLLFEALDTLEEHMPPAGTFAMNMGNSFSYQTVLAHSAIKGYQWRVVEMPTTLNGHDLSALPDVVFWLAKGTNESLWARYIANGMPNLAPRYSNIFSRSFGGDTLRVTIYRKQDNTN